MARPSVSAAPRNLKPETERPRLAVSELRELRSESVKPQTARLMNLTLGRLAGRSVADSWPEIIQSCGFGSLGLGVASQGLVAFQFQLVSGVGIVCLLGFFVLQTSVSEKNLGTLSARPSGICH